MCKLLTVTLTDFVLFHPFSIVLFCPISYDSYLFQVMVVSCIGFNR